MLFHKGLDHPVSCLTSERRWPTLVSVSMLLKQLSSVRGDVFIVLWCMSLMYGERLSPLHCRTVPCVVIIRDYMRRGFDRIML